MEADSQKALQLLNAAQGAFVPNADVSFDGLYSRFRALDPKAYRGEPFRQLESLLQNELKPGSGAPEIWLLEAGDFVLPQYWDATNGEPLSFVLLQASPIDGITIADAQEAVKMDVSFDPFSTMDPCWFWISPVRQGPMVVMVQGRVQADLGGGGHDG